jgi:hypothetical protein
MREMERAMGIEPTAQAWEAWVLPLYDARYSSILMRSPGDLQTALRRRQRRCVGRGKRAG